MSPKFENVLSSCVHVSSATIAWSICSSLRIAPTATINVSGSTALCFPIRPNKVANPTRGKRRRT